MSENRLLFVTNLRNEERAEDLFLAEELANDWNVTIADANDAARIAESGDYKAVFIRNAWPSNEFDEAFTVLESLVSMGRIRSYNPPSASRGFHENKAYLVDLYQAGFPVIPSWLSKEKIHRAGYQDHAPVVFKSLCGCSGHGVIFGSLADLPYALPGLFQPAMKFEHEVSLFFLDGAFLYALHSAGPGTERRWQLSEYKPSDYDLNWARRFVHWNHLPYGIQRIDGGRTKDGKLWLIEVEDFLPYLSLDILSAETKERVVKELLDSVRKHLSIVSTRI